MQLLNENDANYYLTSLVKINNFDEISELTYKLPCDIGRFIVSKLWVLSIRL